MFRSPFRAATLGAALLVAVPAAATAQNPKTPPKPTPPVLTPTQPRLTPPIRMAASSFASVEVHVASRPIGNRWYAEDAALTGPARIRITYGQPHARGRQVEGGLIPLDSVWRFGANEATTLHTDVDLAIGTLVVPRGDYSLFLRHTRDRWELIVNTRTGEWGTDYVASKDLGRIALAATPLGDLRDALSVYLVPEVPRAGAETANLRGTLRIEWGHTALTAPWVVQE